MSLAIDDFDRISEQTPLIGDLRPGGRYVALDVDRAGALACWRSGSWKPGSCTAT